MAAIGRNEPCPCGSGKKYKKCCVLKERKASFASRVVISLIGLMLLTGAIVMLMSLDELTSGESAGPGRVWSEAHQHYH